MMAVVEALLALFGLGVLILLASVALSDDSPPTPPSKDVATPYREGLHAAMRMQAVAQDLERQIYTEAAKHAHGPDDPPSAQVAVR